MSNKITEQEFLKRLGECEREIEEAENEVFEAESNLRRAKGKRERLLDSQRGWYVGYFVESPGDDYSKDYVVPLGFLSKPEADVMLAESCLWSVHCVSETLYTSIALWLAVEKLIATPEFNRMQALINNSNSFLPDDLYNHARKVEADFYNFEKDMVEQTRNAIVQDGGANYCYLSVMSYEECVNENP